MKTRTLGKNGLTVSEIGFGAMGFSQSYGVRKSKEESIPVIRAAVENGVTFFDNMMGLFGMIGFSLLAFFLPSFGGGQASLVFDHVVELH